MFSVDIRLAQALKELVVFAGGILFKSFVCKDSLSPSRNASSHVVGRSTLVFGGLRVTFQQ